MATRRSRIQVKPNIGGPKVGAAKAPPPLKIPDRSSKKEVGPSSPLKSPRVTSPKKSPRVTSPVKSTRVSSPVKSPRVTTPLKSPRVAYPIRCTLDKVASIVENSPDTVENQGSDQQKQQQQETASSVEIKKDGHVNNKRDKETAEGSSGATEQSAQGPKRAKLRRFGTVNVGLTRGSKTANTEAPMGNDNTVTKNEVDKIDGEIGTDGKESTEAESNNKTGELDKTEGIETNENSGTKDQLNEGGNEDIAEAKVEKTGADKGKPKASMRARLPKAKPNFLDASRKRSKPTEENSAAGVDNNQESPAEPSPSPSTSKTVGESSTSDTPGPLTKYTNLQTKPTLPKSPQKSHSALPSQSYPVKTAGKLYGDKDKNAKQKSVNVTEPFPQPPPAKKVRPPRIDAPTDKPPDRGRMRMRDLIYWNPTNNPMKPKEKREVLVKEMKDKGKDKAKEKENTAQEPLPPALEGGEEDAMPVPQVTIGPDGNIVINEQSLVVKNKLEDKGPSQDNEPIDETEMFSTYGTFRKVSRSRRWSEKETAKFYKALAMVGIDFFLIQKILPNRKRFELTKKFKLEEKKNGPLIERVLKERLHFDESVFENLSEEEEDEKDRKKREQQEKKEQRKREKEEKKKAAGEKKKKTGLRQKSNKSPYEPDLSSSDSEAERELEKNFRENPDVRETGIDKAKPGSSKSGKDTEVVNILMDMSKGRLPGTEGEGKAIQPDGDPLQYVNQSYADDTVTIVPQGSQQQQVYLNSRNSLIANLQQSIPGIQNIIAIEAQSIYPQGGVPSLTGSDLRAMAEGQTSNVIVQNNYPPYQIIEQPSADPNAVISSQNELGEAIPQTEVNNDLTYVEMVNANSGNLQAENQTYTVDNGNQISSEPGAIDINLVGNDNTVKEVIIVNSTNESYTAIRTGERANSASETGVNLLNSENVTHEENSEMNVFQSPSQTYTPMTPNQPYTPNQSIVSDSPISAYKAPDILANNSSMAKSLRKETAVRGTSEKKTRLVKTATGEIVEIEIINDELETVKTEPDIEIQDPGAQVLHAGGEKDKNVLSRPQQDQAAENIMQALREKLESAKNSSQTQSRPVVQSPSQPARSLLQSTPKAPHKAPSNVQVVRSPVLPAQSPAQAGQSPIILARSPAKAFQSPLQSAQSILPQSQSPMKATQSKVQVFRSPMQAVQSPAPNPPPNAQNQAGIAQSPVDEAAQAVESPRSSAANSLPSLGPTLNGNQIISQTLLSPESASRMPGLPQPGPNDQYVLVTVMPESGTETIIHVYRLHGGQLA